MRDIFLILKIIKKEKKRSAGLTVNGNEAFYGDAYLIFSACYYYLKENKTKR